MPGGTGDSCRNRRCTYRASIVVVIGDGHGEARAIIGDILGSESHSTGANDRFHLRNLAGGSTLTPRTTHPFSIILRRDSSDMLHLRVSVPPSPPVLLFSCTARRRSATESCSPWVATNGTYLSLGRQKAGNYTHIAPAFASRPNTSRIRQTTKSFRRRNCRRADPISRRPSSGSRREKNRSRG